MTTASRVSQTRLPQSLSDIALLPSERGLTLGMTNTGKSSLHDALIAYDYQTYPRQDIIVFDTKPCYRGERELSGLSTSGRLGRYRHWDRDKGVLLPHSVAIGPDIGDPATALEQCWAQQYRLIVAQFNDRLDMDKRGQIGWLSRLMRYAYTHKRKGRPLKFYVDELNHWMYRNTTNADIIFEVLTSGRENGIGLHVGAQRPRNIGRNSIESLTTLYWFYTPLDDDVKDLWQMGVPPEARPGTDGSHTFYVFRRGEMRHVRGMAKLPQPARKSPY